MIDRASAVGVKLIHGWEQLRLHSYLDQAGLPTIGWGHLIVPGDPDFSEGITEEQADEIFRRDLRRFERRVAKEVTLTGIRQLEFDAMVSLAYNIGERNFARSSVLSRVNAGLRDQAPKHFADWRKTGGRVSRGLVRRRTLEAQLFVDARRGERWGHRFLDAYFGAS